MTTPKEFNDRVWRDYKPNKNLTPDQLKWALDRIEKQSQDTGVAHDDVVKQWIERLP